LVKIVVNAVPLRVAGGRSVGLNFIASAPRLAPDCEIVAFVPSGCGYEGINAPNLSVRPVPPSFHRLALRPAIDWIWWPRTLARESPAVVFSMGNIPLPTHLPQVVVLQQAFITHANSEAWNAYSAVEAMQLRFLARAFRKRARYASIVATQTEVCAERVRSDYGVKCVVVVPNAATPLPADRAPHELTSLPRNPGPTLVCLSRYYPHKNIEVFLPLAREIRAAHSSVRLVTTFDAADHRKAADLLARRESEGLGDVWVNLGAVDRADIPRLLSSCSGLLLPTLLESYSGTYVEAMQYGLPIFTSDRDFAHEVCGEGAFYFDPHSPQSILQCITAAFASEGTIHEHVEYGRQRLSALPTWDDVARRYLDLLRSAAVQSADDT
jgi:glycosyltransferase involved in cell wall biosynthesis